MTICARSRTFFLKSIVLLCCCFAVAWSLYLNINFRDSGKEMIGEYIPDGCPIFELSFNPNRSNHIALGTWCGNTIFYNLSGETVLHKISRSNTSVSALTYSTDGSLIAIGYNDGAVSVHLVSEMMKPIVSSSRLDYQIRNLIISPDNRYLIVQGSSRLTIWEIQNDVLNKTYEGESCFDVCFTHDATLLLILNDDGSVSVRPYAKGVLTNPVSELTGDYRRMSISSQGDMVALSSESITDVYQVEDTELKKVKTFNIHSEGVAISPRGEFLAIADQIGAVTIWDIASETRFSTLMGHSDRLFKGHSDRVNAIAFSPDGRTLATGGQDLRMRLWTIPVILE